MKRYRAVVGGSQQHLISTYTFIDQMLRDLRHTHATLMLRQGVNIKALQERLGHSTITTTLDIYAHVTPGMQKEAALRFEEALRVDVRRKIMVQADMT